MMKSRKNVSLKTFTTFQVEAVAEDYVRFDAVDDITCFLRAEPLKRRRSLILGGGSNLLFLDDFPGVVLHPAMKGIAVVDEKEDHVLVRAMAGEAWDDLVAFTVARGWGGIENLSHIPGNVGASVIQNIGAYGMEAGDAVDTVEAVCLADGKRAAFLPEECGFGYRSSRFKGEWAGRFMITAVVFRLFRKPACVLHYPGVQAAVEGLGDPHPGNVRRAIITLRASKLPDPAKIPNVGSFFKNPVVSRAGLETIRKMFPDLPFHAQRGGRFKLPAGWLIEQCGWRGRAVGNAAVHRDHALVLVNLGGACGREIYDLSERIRRSVAERFGVNLEREVVVVR